MCPWENQIRVGCQTTFLTQEPNQKYQFQFSLIIHCALFPCTKEVSVLQKFLFPALTTSKRISRRKELNLKPLCRNKGKLRQMGLQYILKLVLNGLKLTFNRKVPLTIVKLLLLPSSFSLQQTGRPNLPTKIKTSYENVCTYLRKKKTVIINS